MAAVRILKIDTDGINVEHALTDDITFNSFTAGAGPVMSPTGIDMNGQDVTDLSDIVFADPSVGTINQTAGGALVADNIVAKDRDNTMAAASAILFPAVADVAAQLDMFQVPNSSALPMATPANNSSPGFLVEFNGSLYMWDGAAWNDLGVADSTNAVTNVYTAGTGGIAIQDCVYISAADTVLKASATGGGIESRAMGFAPAAIVAAASGDIQSEGVLAGFTGLTAGSRYFLSATAGLITLTKPAGTGNTIVQVGYAKSATELHIHIEQLGRLA